MTKLIDQSEARPTIRARCSTRARRQQCRRTQSPCQQTPCCGDDGTASPRRQSPTTGEHDHEVRLSALRSQRIPAAIRRERQASGGMSELRKGVDLRSVDVVRIICGAGNAEAARCDEVAEPRGCDGPTCLHDPDRTSSSSRRETATPAGSRHRTGLTRCLASMRRCPQAER